MRILHFVPVLSFTKHAAGTLLLFPWRHTLPTCASPTGATRGAWPGASAPSSRQVGGRRGGACAALALTSGFAGLLAAHDRPRVLQAASAGPEEAGGDLPLTGQAATSLG